MDYEWYLLGSLLFMYFSLMVLNPTPPSKYLISTLETLAGFSTGSILWVIYIREKALQSQ